MAQLKSPGLEIQRTPLSAHSRKGRARRLRERGRNGRHFSIISPRKSAAGEKGPECSEKKGKKEKGQEVCLTVKNLQSRPNERQQIPRKERGHPANKEEKGGCHLGGKRSAQHTRLLPHMQKIRPYTKEEASTEGRKAKIRKENAKHNLPSASCVAGA